MAEFINEVKLWALAFIPTVAYRRHTEEDIVN